MWFRGRYCTGPQIGNHRPALPVRRRLSKTLLWGGPIWLLVSPLKAVVWSPDHVGWACDIHGAWAAISEYQTDALWSSVVCSLAFHLAFCYTSTRCVFELILECLQEPLKNLKKHLAFNFSSSSLIHMHSYTKLLGHGWLGMNLKNHILALIQPVAVWNVV